MDHLDLVPRADVEASRRVHEHFVTASSSNQTYSHITASGSSRVHNGNNYYITYDCSTGHGSLPTLLADQQALIEHVSRSSQKRKRSVSDVAETTHDDRERQTLATVLESLGQYSKSMQQQSEGEQSTRIAAQLAFILESFEQAASGENKTADLESQLQDLKYQLRRARSIKINAVSPQARTSRPYKAYSKATRIISGNWQISLTTKVLHSRSIDGQILIETCSALDVQRRMHSSQIPCIAAFFSEKIDVDQTVLMHPVVLAYNQVDSRAKVFDVVRNDDLDGLMKLLARGQASIRDCDKEGRSLLHHACYYASEDICKFLTDSGCDLDRTALSLEYNFLKNTPLSSLSWAINFVKEDPFERSLVCRKHLLQAGADPTLGTTTTTHDTILFSTIIMSLGPSFRGRRSTTTFEHILHEGSAFFDVRSFREWGQSIWMRACSESGELASPKILQVLVQAGAMIAEVDKDGWNCLFNCVVCSTHPQRSNEFEALRYLLTIFRDIFAQDFKGRSIFDVLADNEPGRDARYGSYKQDLLYCALYRSGLAYRSHIPLPPPGRLRLDRDYRPSHYRALLYLDTWETSILDNKICVPDYNLIDKKALSQQERQAAPGLVEWEPSDLTIMEERISQAMDLDEGREEKGTLSF